MEKYLFRKRVFLGTVISLVALYFAFHNIDFTHLWFTLKDTKWFYVASSAGILVTSTWIHAWRWQVILQKSKIISLRLLLEGEFIGIFGNNVCPMRMGEILRSYISHGHVHVLPHISRVVAKLSKEYNVLRIRKLVNFIGKSSGPQI